ncbi:hypothetical protein GQ43DRAFT_153787 [Delitschia confertaspora ATCC 74209]|uniref:Uncharacterized protein n=1 Tax=Delitschia confertaspora ATCC 74209 TaxID=1513339 RepID=A0A9P4JG12_9PLEO|nr:hypothetical protein GQ43DRAFT_153787 [Delitschia confertaspora ATCC 74209]
MKEAYIFDDTRHYLSLILLMLLSLMTTPLAEALKLISFPYLADQSTGKLHCKDASPKHPPNPNCWQHPPQEQNSSGGGGYLQSSASFQVMRRSYIATMHKLSDFSPLKLPALRRN